MPAARVSTIVRIPTVSAWDFEAAASAAAAAPRANCSRSRLFRSGGILAAAALSRPAAANAGCRPR